MAPYAETIGWCSPETGSPTAAASAKGNGQERWTRPALADEGFNVAVPAKWAV